ncbi:hypothetical protein CAPTEDRAFT_187672 [Capitella teleta]|uniref:Uncharacterized protein n=1 Tax=Capitella teleta TaxID=283909 RepID=R7V7Y5_CAPTE|nr:hypothetical protein CAPTEDRAFT_187672 [Capitella teleta]|eukprot:ELU11865.1 hypothetical protein CAPTEDRAFT_187672 [Capitella teleta]
MPKIGGEDSFSPTPECLLHQLRQTLKLLRQAAEESFSVLNKSHIRLSQMKPVNHIFMTRFLIHLRNIERNSRLLTKMRKSVTATHEQVELRRAPSGSVHLSSPKEVVNPGGKSRLKTASNTKVVNPPRKKVRFALEDIFEPPVWKLAASSADPTKVLAPHPPYDLTAEDFSSLRGQNWITDTVIDCYLHMHVPQQTLHLSTQSMTAISQMESVQVALAAWSLSLPFNITTSSISGQRAHISSKPKELWAHTIYAVTTGLECLHERFVDTY